MQQACNRQHRRHGPGPELNSDEQAIATLDALLADGGQRLCIVVAPDNLDEIEVVVPPGGTDRLRASIAARIAAECPAATVLARRAGRQFVVVLPDADLAAAADMAARLILAVPQCRVAVDGRRPGVTARVATLSTALARPCTAERVLQLADAAAILARGRISGAGSVFLAGDTALAGLELAARHLTDLPEAVDQGRIRLSAQEIVSLAPHPAGYREYEVLMQLEDADGQLHPPGSFIGRAEKSALIELLDRGVISTALIGHADALQAAPHVRLSLNISGRSLSNPDLWPFVDQVLAASGIDPARIQLEITETAAILDLPAAQENVRRIRAAGCRVALDDFGAGLSGFAYLNSFDLDGIKIDGALIPGLADPDSAETAIVSMLIRLARRLDLEVVAEHVASEPTLDALRAMGVGKVQGFLMGWPKNLRQVLEAEAKSV